MPIRPATGSYVPVSSYVPVTETGTGKSYEAGYEVAGWHDRQAGRQRGLASVTLPAG